MVAFLLALFFLKKKKFQFANRIIFYVGQNFVLFFIKSVGMRTGQLSTIFNLSSEKVYSKHVW